MKIIADYPAIEEEKNMVIQVLTGSNGEELSLLLNHIQEINPKKVMLYSLDRETPAKKLVKIERTELEYIAEIIRNKGIVAEVY